MKLSHAGLMILANLLLLGKTEGVTGVGSSVLLGHWSMQLFIILFATTAAFVIAYLYAVNVEFRVRLQIYKIACSAAAKGASIGWLLNWMQSLKLSFKIVVIERKSTRLNSSHLGISYAVFC